MWLFTLFFLFNYFQSRAQYIPAAAGDGVVVDDIPPAFPTVRSNNVENTGTDAIMVANPNAPISQPDQLCVLQVFVWDGTHSGFGWALGNQFNLSGTIFFTDLPECGSPLTDPDVVLTKARGQIVAVVVGIDEDNYVRTYNFIYDTQSNQFEFAGNCNCRYGAAWPMIRENIGNGESVERPQSGFTLGRVCRSPNIDVNEQGDMAIVWVEQETVRVEAKLGFPFSGISIYNDFTRGNVLTAFNNAENILNGNHCFTSCNSRPRQICDWARIREAGNDMPIQYFFHDFTTIQGLPLFEDEEFESINPKYWYSYSDVAVSYRDPSTQQAVVTYTFYRNYTLSSGRSLMVRQYPFNFCRPVKFQVTDYSFGGLVEGIPRIAAVQQKNNQSGNHRDFAIVLALTVANCDTSGYSLASTVRMVGTYGGVPVNGGYAVNLIDNQDISNRSNNNPVITYAPLKPNGEPSILVAWESVPAVLPAAQTDVEIVAALYDPATFKRIPNQYSIVNFQNTNQHGEIQKRPSVAGRQLTVDVRSAYFWYNALSKELSYKTSNSGAGNQPINATYCQNPSTQSQPDEMPSGGIFIHPNAADQSITVEVKGTNGDNIEIAELEITDLSGKKVYHVKPAPNSGTITMALHPKMGKGTYMLHAKTNQGVFTTRLIKN